MTENSKTGSRTRDFLTRTDPSDLEWFDFVDRYGPRILRWCRRKGLDRQACEQVTQDVLSRLSKSLKTFRHDGSSFRGWLYGVTRHAISDYRRTWERGDVQFMEATETLLESAENFIDDIVASDIQQIAEARTQAKVTVKQWEAFVLREQQCKDYLEISALMNVSTAALHNYVSAVKTALMNEIHHLHTGTVK